MSLVLSGDQNNVSQELTDAEVNHLRRLLAWLTCEFNLGEAGQHGLLMGLNMAVEAGADLERAQSVLDGEAARIRSVPAYIRNAVKMLTKAVRDHDARTRVINELYRHMKFRCAHCGKTNEKPAGHINRARGLGLNLYCNRRCSRMGRRQGKTTAQKRAEKAAYDREYRAANLARIKASKKAYFQRTYDRVAAAEYRKKRMPKHVEYCRQPAYKAWKKGYDRKYRAKKVYGAFDDAFLLTQDITNEIKGRTTRHEVKYQNGATNKAQRRKRQGVQEERGRTARRGSPGHPAAHGW